MAARAGGRVVAAVACGRRTLAVRAPRCTERLRPVLRGVFTNEDVVKTPTGVLTTPRHLTTPPSLRPRAVSNVRLGARRGARRAASRFRPTLGATRSSEGRDPRAQLVPGGGMLARVAPPGTRPSREASGWSARCCAGRGATGIERGRRSAHGVRPRPTYFLSETPSTVILRVMRGQSQPRRTRSHGACATSVPQGGEWYPSPGGRGRRQPRLTKRPPLHPAVRYTTHVQGWGLGGHSRRDVPRW